MKSKEEIIKALRLCGSRDVSCARCPYNEKLRGTYGDDICAKVLKRDAADLLESGMKIPYKKPEIIKGTDLVPVVRCKDCKSRRVDGYCTKFQNNISGIAVSWFIPEDDGFCSYGERKEE